MVLRCRCGWTGINLVPDYDNDTANCPTCGRPFKGIPAHAAEYAGVKRLSLCLDDLHDGEFTSTKHDIGGKGHYIIIDEKNKDAAIEEMTRQFKVKATFLFKPTCRICGEQIDDDSAPDSCWICSDCCPGHHDCKECDYHG